MVFGEGFCKVGKFFKICSIRLSMIMTSDPRDPLPRAIPEPNKLTDASAIIASGAALGGREDLDESEDSEFKKAEV